MNKDVVDIVCRLLYCFRIHGVLEEYRINFKRIEQCLIYVKTQWLINRRECGGRYSYIFNFRLKKCTAFISKNY